LTVNHAPAIAQLDQTGKDTMNYGKPKSKRDKGSKPPISANFSPPPTEKTEALSQSGPGRPKLRAK